VQADPNLHTVGLCVAATGGTKVVTVVGGSETAVAVSGFSIYTSTSKARTDLAR